MGLCYDSTNATGIPLSANAKGVTVAGYVDGRWPSYMALVERFPLAFHVSITVLGGTADVLDVENGDAVASSAPPWVSRMRALGRTPTVYCSRVSAWPEVQAAFRSAGVIPPHYWIADYTGKAHLVPGSAVTQWADEGPYDISETDGTWPNYNAPTPTPTPKRGQPTMFITAQEGEQWLCSGSTAMHLLTPGDVQSFVAIGVPTNDSLSAAQFALYTKVG